ncbi:hypothetical protein ACFLTS_04640 [Chloroflexota bacterium]
MALTIEFLYENGEPVKALDDEVLDEAKVRSILKLKVFDTITLGSEREKKNYLVLKIEHRFVSAEMSGKGEDNMHYQYTVKQSY